MEFPVVPVPPDPVMNSSLKVKQVGSVTSQYGLFAPPMSAAARARNVGAALLPEEGPASTVLAVCVSKAGANVPVVVTGDPLTVELNTVPSPVIATEVTGVAETSWPLEFVPTNGALVGTEPPLIFAVVVAQEPAVVVVSPVRAGCCVQAKEPERSLNPGWD
jgi:hypothetical protein